MFPNHKSRRNNLKMCIYGHGNMGRNINKLENIQEFIIKAFQHEYLSMVYIESAKLNMSKEGAENGFGKDSKPLQKIKTIIKLSYKTFNGN